jgi:hypothetical protein
MQGDLYIIKSGPLMSDRTIHNKKIVETPEKTPQRMCFLEHRWFKHI